jgi:hypothetical protein
MAKEIICLKNTPNGELKIILRIIGQFLYFKYNDTSYSRQVVKNFRDKGIGLIEKSGWLRVNLFSLNEIIQLGDIFLDIKSDTESQIEEKLSTFYINEYKKQGFLVEVKNG